MVAEDRDNNRPFASGLPADRIVIDSKIRHRVPMETPYPVYL